MVDGSNFGIDDTEANAGYDPVGSGVGVVRVGKRDYAVGLYWNSVTVSSEAAKEARAMAGSDRVGADFYCIRSGATPQFGLGFRSAGHKSSMPSLAAHLASVKSGSWIGLFEVPGGFYLIAVRDDGILAECDRFIADSSVATDVFQDFLVQSEWGESIAPASLDIPGTKEVPIDGLIEGRPPARLTEVRRTGNFIRIGLAVALVGGVLIGGMSYMSSLEQERLEAEFRAKLEQAQKLMRPDEKVVVPPMPWEGKPLASAVLDECVREVKRFPTDIPGWNVTELICENGMIAAALDRSAALGSGGGPVTWIKRFVSSDGFNPSIDFPPEGSGSRVRLQWPMKALPHIPVDLKTLKLFQVRRALVEVFESRMTMVNLQDADSNDFWKGMTFRFSTKAEPTGFADLIAALPGAIMTRIRLDVRNAEWHLEGKIYEQLPPPQPK